jgi:hypothetical protein
MITLEGPRECPESGCSIAVTDAAGRSCTWRNIQFPRLTNRRPLCRLGRAAPGGVAAARPRPLPRADQAQAGAAGFPPFREEWGGFYRPAVKAWLDSDNRVGADKVAADVDHDREDGPETFDAAPRKKPGFKRGRTTCRTGTRSRSAKDPMGFPDTCIALPPDASDERDRRALPGTHRAAARAHRAGSRKSRRADSLKTRYDGTMTSACRIYQEHPLSRLHDVKHTRARLPEGLRVIEATVGAAADPQRDRARRARLVQRMAQAGTSRIAAGAHRSRARRGRDGAHRDLLHGRAAQSDCKLLAEELERQVREGRRARGGADLQQAAPSSAPRSSFAPRAHHAADRARSHGDRRRRAVRADAAPERTSSASGRRPARRASCRPASRARMLEGETWAGFFTWENIAGWRWRMKTSKSKYRAAPTSI